MLKRYSFLIFFFLSLAAIAHWSDQLDRGEGLTSSPISSSTPSFGVRIEGPGPKLRISEPKHLELIEVFDQLVSNQHYYHSISGSYTSQIDQLGYSIPQTVLSTYELKVVQSGANRFLLTALSEQDGKTTEVASIDQDYHVFSTFPLPAPRSEYLRAQALQHLKVLQEAPPGQIVEETGIFKDYFRYQVQGAPQTSKRIAYAVGVKPPVLGFTVQLNESLNGQKSVGTLMNPSDDIYSSLSFRKSGQQKDFQELAPIVNFNLFSQFDAENVPNSVEIMKKTGPLTVQAIEKSNRSISSSSSSTPSSSNAGLNAASEPLEIEPISE